MRELKFSKELMEKFGKIVIQRKREWNLLQKIWYKIDWRNSKLINLQKWFKTHLSSIVSNGEFLHKCEEFKKIEDQDVRAVAILRHVRRILTYKSDSLIWKVGEMWQTPLTTYNLKTGDCEDGAMLIASFMYFSDIPSIYWDVTCGWVKTSSGQGGHAYLVYYSKGNSLRYVLDWCFRYDSTHITKRKPVYANSYYKDVWFRFNDKESSKTVKTPNEMFQ